MPKLKVRPLEWYMRQEPENLLSDGYVPMPESQLLGRDGYYCQAGRVWFEYEGRGYLAYPRAPAPRAVEYFCRPLTVNDEAILMPREVEAIQQVLKTTRDASVRKSLQACLQLHRDALGLRQCGRAATLARIRILGY